MFLVVRNAATVLLVDQNFGFVSLHIINLGLLVSIISLVERQVQLVGTLGGVAKTTKRSKVRAILFGQPKLNIFALKS